MQFGAHLPSMDFGGHPFSPAHLLDYARTARRLGLALLCANDHVVFDLPWFDGPTALAAVLEASGDMTLATTVALAVVRGPIVLAKIQRATPCVCVSHGPNCATDVPCCASCKFASPLPGCPQGDTQGPMPNYSMGRDGTAAASACSSSST